jgi:hypothetical protein
VQLAISRPFDEEPESFRIGFANCQLLAANCSSLPLQPFLNSHPANDQ